MSVKAAEINVNKSKTTFSSIFVKYGLGFFAIVIIMVFFAFEPKFLSIKNIMNILSTTSVMGITSLGVSIILSTGEIDFAAGAEFTAVAVVFGVLLDKGIPGGFPVGLLFVLLMVTLIGLLNSILNVKVGIPAFIATMGVSLIFIGISYGITGGQAINSVKWGAAWRFVGQTYIFNVIPVSVIVLLVIAAIMWAYAELTTQGKRMYGVGSNPTATKYVGINAAKQKIEAFIIAAVLCGIAGFVQASMVNRVSYAMGDAVLFQSITAVMLGATFLHPGVFNVPGTLLGSLIVIIMINGFTMTSVPAFARDLVLGVVMVIAVTLVTYIRKRSEKTE